ncbi:MAG: DUF721 domain-containing protein [Legionellaceae bacterium]|nr:DUF721 domain-containing protein [Legionellaceae bacterium]
MRHITQCINNKLANICAQAIKIEDISKLLLTYLPDDLKHNCRAASFIRGCLVIVVADAIWASQLRYVVPELRDRLRNEAKLYQISSIKIIIDPKIYSDSSTQKAIKKTVPSKKSPWTEILKSLSEE